MFLFVFIVQILCYIINYLLLRRWSFVFYCYCYIFFFSWDYFLVNINLAYLFLFNPCDIKSVNFKILLIAGAIS